MKKLTTGEVAKLFTISKSKVRHYVDTGILSPKRNPENGYYYFEETDIYRLYQLTFFRDIGFSIEEIHEHLLGDSDNTILMFEHAEKKLQNQMDNLLVTQKKIKEIIYARKKYQLNKVIFLDRSTRYYQKITNQIIDEDSVNYVEAVKLGIFHLEELYYVLTSTPSVTLCSKSNKDDSDYQFPAGTYACKSFVAKDRTTIENQIEQFLCEVNFNTKEYTNEAILLYENVPCSLAYNDRMVYSLEVKI